MSLLRVDVAGQAHAAALSTLPGMGAANLAELLAARAPSEVWADIVSGRLLRPPRPPGPGRQPRARSGTDRSGSGRSWAALAARLEPESWWAPMAARRIGVTWPGRADYPAALTADPQRPGVLFWRGELAVLDRPCVAVVGTRSATPDGRAVAFEMGRDLTRAGVCVVSGLALGIDGAAHAGALQAVREGAGAGPVGVAASGVDVPYPRRHSDLWAAVTGAGAVLSENQPGRSPQAWMFPWRNRVIAALSGLVVVVESHQSGGSLITVEAALERGIEVRAVPGPVHSPASAGSNQLLWDGPGPVRHAGDVLDALGLFLSDRRPDSARQLDRRRRDSQLRAGGLAPAGPLPPSTPAHRPAGVPGPGPGRSVDRDSGAPPRPTVRPPEGAAAVVLEALGWRPVSAGQVMARTGLEASAVVPALDQLAAAGWAEADAGWWRRRH